MIFSPQGGRNHRALSLSLPRSHEGSLSAINSVYLDRSIMIDVLSTPGSEEKKGSENYLKKKKKGREGKTFRKK